MAIHRQIGGKINYKDELKKQFNDCRIIKEIDYFQNNRKKIDRLIIEMDVDPKEYIQNLYDKFMKRKDSKDFIFFSKSHKEHEQRKKNLFARKLLALGAEATLVGRDIVRAAVGGPGLEIEKGY